MIARHVSRETLRLRPCCRRLPISPRSPPDHYSVDDLRRKDSGKSGVGGANSVCRIVFDMPPARRPYLLLPCVGVSAFSSCPSRHNGCAPVQHHHMFAVHFYNSTYQYSTPRPQRLNFLHKPIFRHYPPCFAYGRDCVTEALAYMPRNSAVIQAYGANDPALRADRTAWRRVCSLTSSTRRWWRTIATRATFYPSR